MSFNTNTKKNIISLAILLTFLSGCGSSSTSTGSTSTDSASIGSTSIGSTSTDSTCNNGSAIQQGKIKDSISGAGLKDVTITIDGCSTITNEQGFYSLNNISENAKSIVTITAKNSYKHSILIDVHKYSKGTTKLSPNYLEYSIDTYEMQEHYNSSNTNKIIKTPSNASIDLSLAAYTDTSGNNYTGTIYANTSYLNTSTDLGKSMFPGTFEGENDNGVIVPFISYGFIVIELTDPKGNILNINNNITLTFPSENINTKDEYIPLWHYNHAQGIWQEEGYAQLQEDGSYKGEVSHLGSWSLSKPIEEELGTYRGRLVYENGNNVTDARVYAIGKNWIALDISTDSNGFFELQVIPGEDFKLKAYNYKYKYGASYPNILPAVKSGEIIENRI
jgi:hypothetical protein